jgi:hypothetical protein
MMSRFAGATHSLLRIVAALVFICPGGMKLFAWFGGMPGPAAKAGLPPLLLAAGLIEVIGGTLILVGLFTRPVAFIASGEMAWVLADPEPRRARRAALLHLLVLRGQRSGPLEPGPRDPALSAGRSDLTGRRPSAPAPGGKSGTSSGGCCHRISKEARCVSGSPPWSLPAV